MGIYSTLNIGRDAILTSQRAIELTGHNIANVNTPGYSRQRLILQAKAPIDIGVGQMGTGVDVNGIERIYDIFLGDQINSAAQDLGKWEAQRNSLERVEIIFDESSGFGLNNAMSAYWASWQDLANNPNLPAARQIVVGEGENLANTFNTIYSDLVGVQSDIDAGISVAVDQINEMATQLDDLNHQIALSEASGNSANDFRDRRDQLMKELSELIDFTSTEASDGSITVTLGDGNDLVDAAGAHTLYATDTDGDTFLDIAWSDPSGTNINANISGGNIKGWLETRDVIINGYLTSLETLAATIRDQVNTVHSTGRAPDNSQNNFFVPTGTLASGTFAVNPDLVADSNLVAAGDTSDSGDNRTAIKIANLQHATFLIGGDPQTFDNYYGMLVSNVGIDVRNSSQNYDHLSAVASQLDNYRESISGVSLDEEMVNLIKFQHAYDAAAKLISTVDEMLDTLIAMV
jgi:flagellar hook-associated protein 1 FlgK